MSSEDLVDAVHRAGYSNLTKLGVGGSSTVLGAEKGHSTVALKCFAFPRHWGDWNREVLILNELSHPNIISLNQVVDGTNIGILELELLSRDLFMMIEEEQLSINAVRLLFGQICVAVRYCHMKGVAHLDIKPENILVNNSCTAKLADFASSLQFVPGHTIPFPGRIGSFYYCAPEVLLRKDFMPDKADVWSLGILLYIMMFKSWPYLPGNSNSKNSVYNQIVSAQVTLGAISDPLLIDLLESIFRLDPLDRPSVDDILLHPWFCLDQESGTKKLASLTRSISKIAQGAIKSLAPVKRATDKSNKEYKRRSSTSGNYAKSKIISTLKKRIL